MLAYRHAFHAGNHADVLKHTRWRSAALHEPEDQALRRSTPMPGRRLFARKGRSRKRRRVRTRHWPACGVATTCPQRWPTIALVAPVQHPSAAEAVPRFTRLRRCCCARRTTAPFDCTRRHRISRPTWRGQKAPRSTTGRLDGLKSQVRQPQAGRGADGPEYEATATTARDRALRDALTRFCRGVYVVWYPQCQQARSGAAAEAPGGARAEGLAACAAHGAAPASKASASGSGMFIINRVHAARRAARVLPT